MKYFEYGKENKEIMVMLHGGLPAEQPERFKSEVRAAHTRSLEKQTTQN